MCRDIPIWLEEGLAIGGGDISGDTPQCAWSNPPSCRKNGHKQTLAHWGFSHLGGGGASYRGRGRAMGTLYSVHGLTPPPHPRKTGHKRTLAHWDIPIWVEEGLAIGGGDSSGDTLQCAWSTPHPRKNGHKYTLAHWGYSHLGGGGASF